MRLFIALPFSDNVKNYLEGLQSGLPEAKMNLNHHFHITLQFLGEASVEQAQVIMNELKKISFKKFSVKFGEIGFFKNRRGFIQLVYVDILMPEELKKLQIQVENLMKTLGFYPDKPFKPHITLTRIKFADDKIFEQELKKIKTENLLETIDKMVLFESVLSPEGASYNELLTINSND
jgi:2'-5' RNA ligase